MMPLDLQKAIVASSCEPTDSWHWFTAGWPIPSDRMPSSMACVKWLTPIDRVSPWALACTRPFHTAWLPAVLEQGRVRRRRAL